MVSIIALPYYFLQMFAFKSPGGEIKNSCIAGNCSVKLYFNKIIITVHKYGYYNKYIVICISSYTVYTAPYYRELTVNHHLYYLSVSSSKIEGNIVTGQMDVLGDSVLPGPKSPAEWIQG